MRSFSLLQEQGNNPGSLTAIPEGKHCHPGSCQSEALLVLHHCLYTHALLFGQTHHPLKPHPLAKPAAGWGPGTPSRALLSLPPPAEEVTVLMSHCIHIAYDLTGAPQTSARLRVSSPTEWKSKGRNNPLFILIPPRSYRHTPKQWSSSFING